MLDRINSTLAVLVTPKLSLSRVNSCRMFDCVKRGRQDKEIWCALTFVNVPLRIASFMILSSAVAVEWCFGKQIHWFAAGVVAFDDFRYHAQELSFYWLKTKYISFDRYFLFRLYFVSGRLIPSLIPFPFARVQFQFQLTDSLFFR